MCGHSETQIKQHGGLLDNKMGSYASETFFIFCIELSYFVATKDNHEQTNFAYFQGLGSLHSKIRFGSHSLLTSKIIVGSVAQWL